MTLVYCRLTRTAPNEEPFVQVTRPTYPRWAWVPWLCVPTLRWVCLCYYKLLSGLILNCYRPPAVDL